ncbi:site-specific integrase [Pseudomonas oryzihabitans]|uniref:site-specific integrase n=1 Tax=Pseudomonas oryzihabitans TaxID=47885 RepID=UPI00289474B7|nr:site-specific integrase [Pseudomonas oryzihabitans]MDT3721351.1 site-specific integrase [Pseudomonas oryzihabitans]
MEAVNDLNLTFPMLRYGTAETPWDLIIFLYKGGASARSNVARRKIELGELDPLLHERMPLVLQIHAHVTADLVSGLSRNTVENRIRALRQFFSWCDESGASLAMDSVAESFIRYADHLLHLKRTNRSISEMWMYDRVTRCCNVLDRILDRKVSLLKSTRIRKLGSIRKNVSKVDKHDLQKLFNFGHMLSDVCVALSWEASIGELPVSISLRTGQVYLHWSRLQDPEKIAAKTSPARRFSRIAESLKRRSSREADKTLQTRYPLVNLRIACELLIFIAQTGLNLAQAYSLRLEQFHYTSHLDGYQVRTFKRRRQGEVLFEIFQSYKSWLEDYLEFRRRWFPDQADGLLFPLVRRGSRADKPPQFTNVKVLCRALSLPFLGTSLMRGVRINWQLRETKNPRQVADLAQHSVETLLRTYIDPHPQIAKVEITQFQHQYDPSFASPAPGRCLSTLPSPVEGTVKAAPVPDCINSSGCFFCTQHRDIDSQDHVWSLFSLRHLKSLELSQATPINDAEDIHPAMLVIERITEKLTFFKESSDVRNSWFIEAQHRIDEGSHHPAWNGFIRLAEIKSRQKGEIYVS